MEKKTSLKELMSMKDLCQLTVNESVSLAVASIDNRFFKGQCCTLIAEACGRQFPFCRYICVESGYMDSIWKFDSEIHYSL